MVAHIDSRDVGDNLAIHAIRHAMGRAQRLMRGAKMPAMRVDATPQMIELPTLGDDVAAAPPSTAWLSPPPERRLPRDLDLPLGVFDPGALLAEPLEPARAVRSLVHRPLTCVHEERLDAAVRRAA